MLDHEYDKKTGYRVKYDIDGEGEDYGPLVAVRDLTVVSTEPATEG